MEINNETLGQSAEKVICDLCGLDSSDFAHRTNTKLESLLKPLITKALRELPKIVKHAGLQRGLRGKQSKSTVDFLAEDGSTISLKSNLRGSSKVCPSECGQPGQETFDHYFGHLYEKPVNYKKFKRLCLEKPHLMMPIYSEHLFSCDYLVWVTLGRNPRYRILSKTDIPRMDWEPRMFSFTKTLSTWNESCTLKYQGITIGEWQAHQHRHNYKFRFNFENLCRVISG